MKIIDWKPINGFEGYYINELYNYLTTDDIDDSILGGINNGAN